VEGENVVNFENIGTLQTKTRNKVKGRNMLSLPAASRGVLIAAILIALWVTAMPTGLLRSSAAADIEKTKIAVLDFGIEGKGFETEDMGKIVAEWITTAFVKAGRFDVIERRMLKKILGEQQLGLSGALDNESVTELGKLLGVEVIISGSVMKFQDVLEVNARVMDVESASILAAESVKSTIALRLQELVFRMADQIISNFPIEGYIVNRDQNAVSIDPGKRMGVKPGMWFIVFKEGKVIKHPKTGEILDVEKIPTGLIEIKSTSAKMAQGRIVRENTSDAIAYGQQVKSLVDPEEVALVATMTPSPTPSEKAAPAEEEQAIFKFLTKIIETTTPLGKSTAKTEGSTEAIQTEAGQKIKLAILPWLLDGEAPKQNSKSMGVFQQIFSINKLLVPVYSFYEMDPKFRVRAISKGLLSEKEQKNLWKKGGFFASPKPNINLACKIGNHLAVDVVFMCYIYVSDQAPSNAKFIFYLINVISKEVFSDSSTTVNFEERGHTIFKDLVEKVINNYLR